MPPETPAPQPPRAAAALTLTLLPPAANEAQPTTPPLHVSVPERRYGTGHLHAMDFHPDGQSIYAASKTGIFEIEPELVR